MLEIKLAGSGNLYAEYLLFKAIPKEENGFSNEYANITFDQYQNEIQVELYNRAEGINLKEGYVPDSKYILWLDDKAIGLFSFRHYLNDFLKSGPGHIGYAILKDYRNHGYASLGLKLLIDEVKDKLIEDEFYLSCNKDNQASLKTQLKCGAYIHHEDDEHIYTRIKVR